MTPQHLRRLHRPRMKKQTMPNSKIPTLNAQILQLQAEITMAQQVQQQRHHHLRQLLTDQLTSWPVLCGAVAVGFIARQLNTPASDPTASTIPASARATPQVRTEHAATVEISATPWWSTLLSLPLLTQSLWWCIQQLWQLNVFQDLVRQKISKSTQRHPPY